MYIYGKIISMKIKELLEYGRSNLIKKEEPYRLSKILLKYLLKVEDIYLVIHQDEKVNSEMEEEYKKLVELLNKGIPIQYITNYQEFMGLNFYVDENVLIPQPDTEILVEEIIGICRGRSCACPKEQKILDLCTGSGAIGVAIVKYSENVDVTMSDISKKALEIARKNATQNHIEDKCQFIQSDMFKNIESKFDVIVSNPPYIKTEIIKKLDIEVQKEPMLALDGGQDGLEFYRIIVEQAHQYLNQDGILALEIGYNQKEEVMRLLKESDKYTDIYSKKDLAGNDRIIVCKLQFNNRG